MCSYTLLLVVLLAAAVLAEPAVAEVAEEPQALDAALCHIAQAVGREIQAKAPLNDRSAEDAVPALGIFGTLAASVGESSKAVATPLAGPKLFEALLADRLLLAHLAPQQRALFSRLSARCGISSASPFLGESVFRLLDASQRATFAGVTHAMLHTVLLDRGDSHELGNALQLVEELIDIQGENEVLPSDHQFQLIVRLTPDALAKLERAAEFDKGENHVFHKDYPLSFRQFRRFSLQGKEAGLHLCLTRDGRYAQIHIDYRFFLLHLGPANSDVRADGNHQKHKARWPQFKFASSLSKSALGSPVLAM